MVERSRLVKRYTPAIGAGGQVTLYQAKNGSAVKFADYRSLASDYAALESRVRELEEALEPFVSAFEMRRIAYSKRYADRDLGFKNFDKMPDDWAMEKIAFSMGVFRRVKAALSRHEPDSEVQP